MSNKIIYQEYKRERKVKEKERTEIYRILASVIMGAIISIIIFYMLEVIMAQFLVDLILDQLGEDAYFNILLILLMGESIAIVVSIVISIMITKEIKKSIILVSAGLALISNLILWFAISFITMLISYPEIFQNIRWYEILFISPTLIMYFSIYILDNVTRIWLITQISYFILFGIIILLFRKGKKKKIKIKEKNKNYRW